MSHNSFGQELLDQLLREKQSLVESAQDRGRRISSGDVDSSDCYLSEWANGVSQNILLTKISILKNGGTWTFRALFTPDGQLVSDKCYQTRYGKAYKLAGNFWVSAYKKPEYYTKKGYVEKEIQRPAWVSKDGSIFPSRVNYWTGKEVA